MWIVVRGTADKIENDFLKDALRFFNKILLDNEDIKVNLKLVPKFKAKKGRFAWCGPLACTWFTFAPPRVFFIEMDSSLSQHEAGITLAHEFVHIQQLFRGYLKIPPFHPTMAWFGHSLDLKKSDDEQPYEIEARGRERYLYEKFMENRK